MGVDRYAIEFRPAVLRALAKIDKVSQQRIRGAIALLAHDPRPPSARRLKGREALRIRVGDFRILYTIDDGRLVIVVVTVGHRSNVYRS